MVRLELPRLPVDTSLPVAWLLLHPLLPLLLLPLLGVLLLPLVLLVRRLARRPARVECWFCRARTCVPRASAPRWTCPSCGQYNGFAPDGGYDRAVPGQACSPGAAAAPPLARRATFASHSDVLCRRCTDNQRLKAHQLAAFEPLDPGRFDEELRRFRASLERSLGLCAACEARAAAAVRRCDRRVLSQLLEWRRGRAAVADATDGPGLLRRLLCRGGADAPALDPRWLLAGVEVAACAALLCPAPLAPLAPLTAAASAAVQVWRVAAALFASAPGLAARALAAAVCWLPAALLAWGPGGDALAVRASAVALFAVARAALGGGEGPEGGEGVEEGPQPPPESPPPPSEASWRSTAASWRTAPASCLSTCVSTAPTTAANERPLIRPSRLGLALAPSVDSQLAPNGSVCSRRPSGPPSVASAASAASLDGTPTFGRAEDRPPHRPLVQQVVLGLIIGANAAMALYWGLLPLLDRLLASLVEAAADPGPP